MYARHQRLLEVRRSWPSSTGLREEVSLAGSGKEGSENIVSRTYLLKNFIAFKICIISNFLIFHRFETKQEAVIWFEISMSYGYEYDNHIFWYLQT